jgi:ATP-dependent Lon protease
MDNDKSGEGISLPVVVALCSGLLERSLRGGLILVGAINLGGSIDSLRNAVVTIELAIEKGAETVLMPVSARKQLFELSDDMATKVNIQFYSDAQDALIKTMVE